LSGQARPINNTKSLPRKTLRFGDTPVALTDGRIAAERSAVEPAASGAPWLLLDLARDFATTPLLGATGNAEALSCAAAVLQAADIALLALDDVGGLVVMRTVACLANEAADLMTWTGTRAADIDIAMRLGTAYPVGPLAWADAVGISRVVRVLENLQAHYGDMRYRRSPQLSARHHAKGSFHG